MPMLGAEQKKWAWLFIGLLGVGFGSLAVAFFPASSTAVSSPNELQPSAYLDMFTWLNSGAGTALAFKGDEILYQLLSKEPPTFQDPVRDTLNNISNVTHIRTVQQTNPFLQYGFRVLIGDGLLDALKAGNRDYIFYSAGLSPRQLDNARKVLLSKGVCFISKGSDKWGNIGDGIIIVDKQYLSCIVEGLYLMFGVEYTDKDRSDMALCILYRLRDLGYRTRPEIEAHINDAEFACKAELRR